MSKTVVTVASWEPRFWLGLQSILTDKGIAAITLYYMKEYADRTKQVREMAKGLAEQKNLAVSEIQLSFQCPQATWSAIGSYVSNKLDSNDSIMLDITTMPREVTWCNLFWLEQSHAFVEFIYHQPESYGADWLARDPEEPRLVYKLAGLPKVGLGSALVMVTGYDTDRTLQAIDYFEPSLVVLAVQTGQQFQNNERNVIKHTRGRLGSACEVIDIDAYGTDQGYAQLRIKVSEVHEKYNVILCSFGPKLSAMSLYRLQREFKRISLAYIRYRDYSEQYSQGIGDATAGVLYFQSPTIA